MFYEHDFQYAKENNEKDQYFANKLANETCSRGIEKYIASYYDGVKLSKRCLWDALYTYGIKRVAYVCACNIAWRSGDGRFSADNVKWAANYGVEDRDVLINTHSVLLDAFVSMLRKEVGM